MKAHEEKIGRIQTVVWQNKGQNGDEWFSLSMSRLYKSEEDDQWKRSNSFNRADEAALIATVKAACQWIDQHVQLQNLRPKQDQVEQQNEEQTLDRKQEN